MEGLIGQLQVSPSRANVPNAGGTLIRAGTTQTRQSCRFSTSTKDAGLTDKA